MPNAQLRDKLTALVATTLGELATGSASASAKDAIRDPRETNSSVASRLEVLGSQKRFPWSPWLSWPDVTQRFSALGPIARGHTQLHRQDSVEPGAAGVHLRRHLPTDPTQVVPTAFTSRCRLRKGTSECTVASGAPSRFTFGARRPERLCRQSYSFLRQRESGVSSKRHESCCRTPPPGSRQVGVSSKAGLSHRRWRRPLSSTRGEGGQSSKPHKFESPNYPSTAKRAEGDLDHD